MVTIWKYVGTNSLPTEAQFPAGVVDEWDVTLKAEQTRIKAALDAKIPVGKFDDIIADPSSEQYALFLKSCEAPYDRDTIVLKQKVKLLRSEDIWRTGINNCFGVGGYFPTVVDAKKNKMKAARYVLGAVGYKPDVSVPYGVWNPVVAGVLLMRGDTRVYYYRSAIDTFTNWGGFCAVLDPVKGALVTPSIIAIAVQASVMAVYMFEAGLEGSIAAYLSAKSAIIASLVTLALAGSAAATYVLDWNGSTKTVRVTVECTVIP